MQPLGLRVCDRTARTKGSLREGFRFNIIAQRTLELGAAPGNGACTSRAEALRRRPGITSTAATHTTGLGSCAPLRLTHLASAQSAVAARHFPAAVPLASQKTAQLVCQRQPVIRGQTRLALPGSGTTGTAATDTMDGAAAVSSSVGAPAAAAAAATAPAPAGIKLVLVVGVALIDDGEGRSGGHDGNGAVGAERGAGAGAAARVLLAQRPPGKANAGLWEFPGGKVDAGETPEAALVRELREELGIRVSAHDLQPLSFVSYTYPTFHLLMPLYACRRWEDEPHGAEGQAVAWAGEAELLAAGAAAAAATAAAAGAAAAGGAAAGSGAEAVPYPLTPADIPLVPAVVAEMRNR